MTELLVISVAVFGFGMVSRRLSISPVTAPMVFTTVGLLVGTAGASWLDTALEAEAASILVEATLVLVLFTDAVRIDLNALRVDAGIPLRLLAVGMPLTIAAGALVAAALFEWLDLVEALLLAAILAPTDAALGQAVVNDARLPVRIRQSLNTESGLNDGIALPVVTVLIALASEEAAGGGAGAWGRLVVRQIGFGVLLGVAAGWLGGWLLHRRSRVDGVTGAYRQLATLAVVAAAFAGAELLEGNGFIAAFVGGLTFGRVAKEECRDVDEFTEDEGVLLTAITFILFGAVLAGPLISSITWNTVWYAIASLTVVRIVPVLIALIGSRLYLETRLFLGWFGPRGLASILFALLVLLELNSEVADEIALVGVTTVLLSIYAHGLTASPWAGRLSRKLATAPEHMPEMQPMREMPTRWPAS